MKTIISILGRFAAVFLVAMLIETAFTMGQIFNSDLWEYWFAWVVQACYILLMIWATMFWCEDDEVI